MSLNKTYQLEDFQKYLHQEMSAAEMHAFEKACLQDPFLNDAFEGFLASNEQLALKSRDNINKQLAEASTSKVVSMGKSAFSPLKIAAAFILLVGVAYFSVRYFLEPTTPLAQKQSLDANKPLNSTAPLSTTVEDSNLKESDASVETKIASTPSVKYKQQLNQSIAKNQPLPSQENALSKAMNEPAEQVDISSNKIVAAAPSAPKNSLNIADTASIQFIPENGWVMFDKKVKATLNSIKSIPPSDQVRTVTFDFSLDAEGNATNIQLIDGITFRIDDVFKSLILSTKWAKKSNIDRARITFYL